MYTIILYIFHCTTITKTVAYFDQPTAIFFRCKQVEATAIVVRAALRINSAHLHYNQKDGTWHDCT